MSGYENPWREYSPTRRERDRDYYTGAGASSGDPYPAVPPAQMPSEEYHGASRFDSFDEGRRGVPPAPSYVSGYGSTPPPQPYGAAPYGSTSSFDRLNRSSPRLRDTASASASAPNMNTRGVYDSFFPSTPQNDPAARRRPTDRIPSSTPPSRSRSGSPDGLAFGATSSNTADRGVGAPPPGKTFVETMTPLASAAASAAGSALSNLWNQQQQQTAPPPDTRPPAQLQGSSIYDYLAAAYPMVTGQKPAQQTPAIPNHFEFAGMSIDRDWVFERMKETNPWVLLGIVVMAIMIISSIIATLIKLAVIAGILYLVFVFGIQNGAIASLAAGAGHAGPTPVGPGRRRVEQRPARRF